MLNFDIDTFLGGKSSTDCDPSCGRSSEKRILREKNSYPVFTFKGWKANTLNHHHKNQLKQPLPRSPFIPRPPPYVPPHLWASVVKGTIWLKTISSVIITEFRDRTAFTRDFSFLLPTHSHFASFLHKHFHTSRVLSGEWWRERGKKIGTDVGLLS